MAHFHINDSNQTPTYQICTSNDAHIIGLKDGQVLVHLDPAYMQKDNGLLVGIDPRFKNFYIVDQNHLVVQKLDIEWTECSFGGSEVLIEPVTNNETKFTLIWLSLTLLFLIFFLIKRGIRCKRY
jgi:hypothetical protein